MRLVGFSASAIVWIAVVTSTKPAHSQESCWAADCHLPATLCGRLTPGMAVFIGKEVSVAKLDCGAAQVTFSVEEPLWGLREGTRTATVRFADGYRKLNERVFLAVTPTKNGEYFHNQCGAALILPADHDWVREFLQMLTHSTPATLAIRVVAANSYVPLPDARVQLTGAGHAFSGTTDPSGSFLIPTVPAGSYDLAVSKANFTIEQDQRRVSVLPGSCSPLTVRLNPASHIYGHIQDAAGNPIRKVQWFHLIGWSSEQNAQDYANSRIVETDAEGGFSIEGLMPGQYYLGANIWETPSPAQAPFPRTYYPGVPNRAKAVPLIILEGQSLNDIVFRLPDYGEKRRLEVRVVSADGLPVPNAIVEDGPVHDDAPVVSSIGEIKKTDQRGQASFDVWAMSEYRITARLVLPDSFYQSAVNRVAASTSTTWATVVLDRLWLRNSAK